jgi:serine protease Do
MPTPRRLQIGFVLLSIVSFMPFGHAGATDPGALTAVHDLSESFEALSDRVGPAVVQIVSSGYLPVTQGSGSVLAKQRHSGSGVILDASGYIVTNAHVIEQAERIQVQLAGPPAGDVEYRSVLKRKGKLVGAQLVGLDRETDLAVLKIQERDLPHLALGDSEQLHQGELVFAFGSPLGLENTMTLGVVSAVARQLTPDSPMVYIQTDAPINPGNSGGPLVNANGEVVGINTLILSMSGGSEGLGFAVPSNIVRAIFEQIKEFGRVRRGEIGAAAQTVTPLRARGLHLEQQWGVVLSDVYPGSGAAEAGLHPGDQILTLDGKPMENGRQFDVNLYRKTIGQRVTLRVRRDDEEFDIRVRVTERTNDFARFVDHLTPEKNLVRSLGILGIDLFPEVAAVVPMLRSREGVLVASLVPSASHGEGAFVPGDVIHAVNERKVTNLESLRQILSGLSFGDAVVVHVERQGRMRYVAREMD